LQYKNFVYPGPIFPNNFAELEDLENGSFCIYDSNLENPLRVIELKIKPTEKIEIELENSINATEKIVSEISKREINNKIILLRIKGDLDGKISDIKFDRIEEFAMQNGAYFILKNIHNLKIKDAEIEYEIEKSDNIEDEIIKIHSQQSETVFDSKILQLINFLSTEKQEGETSETFSSRILDESRKILEF
jgi:hypothetical protein